MASRSTNRNRQPNLGLTELLRTRGKRSSRTIVWGAGLLLGGSLAVSAAPASAAWPWQLPWKTHKSEAPPVTSTPTEPTAPAGESAPRGIEVQTAAAAEREEAARRAEATASETGAAGEPAVSSSSSVSPRFGILGKLLPFGDSDRSPKPAPESTAAAPASKGNPETHLQAKPAAQPQPTRPTSAVASSDGARGKSRSLFGGPIEMPTLLGGTEPVTDPFLAKGGPIASQVANTSSQKPATSQKPAAPRTVASGTTSQPGALAAKGSSQPTAAAGAQPNQPTVLPNGFVLNQTAPTIASAPTASPTANSRPKNGSRPGSVRQVAARRMPAPQTAAAGRSPLEQRPAPANLHQLPSRTAEPRAVAANATPKRAEDPFAIAAAAEAEQKSSAAAVTESPVNPWAVAEGAASVEPAASNSAACNANVSTQAGAGRAIASQPRPAAPQFEGTPQAPEAPQAPQFAAQMQPAGHPLEQAEPQSQAAFQTQVHRPAVPELVTRDAAGPRFPTAPEVPAGPELPSPTRTTPTAFHRPAMLAQGSPQFGAAHADLNLPQTNAQPLPQQLVQQTASVRELQPEAAQEQTGVMIGNSIQTQAATASPLQGICPVTLRHDRRPVIPRPEYSLNYDGCRYEFVSAKAMAKFQADPAFYAPVASGRDVVLVAAGDTGALGSLKYAQLYRDRLYLFQSEVTYRAFQANPSRFGVE